MGLRSKVLLLLTQVLVAATLDVPPGVIAADDECLSAEGGEGACALNALQVKGVATAESVSEAEDVREEEEVVEAIAESASAAEDAEVEDAAEATADSAFEEDATEEDAADTYPDLTTGFDEPGPYLKEPSVEEADRPSHAQEGWENASLLQKTSFNTWGRSFCETHHVGYFCDGTTRVRCCQQSYGYVKCGTTVHDSHCGYHGSGGSGFNGGGYDDRRRYYGAGYHDDRRRYGSSYDSRRRYYGGGMYYDDRRRYYDDRRRGYAGAGGVWHIHQGWHQSSFCTSHHVGNFCSSHHRVHCCNDHGHFVDCTTRSESSSRC